MLAVIVNGDVAVMHDWAVWLQLAAMLALLGLSSSLGSRGKSLVILLAAALALSVGVTVVEAFKLPCLPQPCPWYYGDWCCP